MTTKRPSNFSRPLRFAALISCLCTALGASTARAVAPNDNFSSASTLSGSSATASNVGATTENSEPLNNDARYTLWWNWTAPSDGYATINTSGSNFDNVLGIFQGTAYGSLNLVGDDHGGLGANKSQTQFPVKQGQLFKIQVGGYGYVTGTIVLNVQVAALSTIGITNTGSAYFGAPATFNDDLINAVPMGGSDWTAIGFNESAGTETAEPQLNDVRQTLWWSWTAPADGFVTIDTTGTDFDNVVNVYQATTFAAYDIVEGDHAGLGQNQSEVQFPVKAGQVFKIQVGGYGYVGGFVVLNLQLGSVTSGGITRTGSQFLGSPAVYNDDFDNAPSLTGSTWTAVGFSDSATTETSEPLTNDVRDTLWWSWTAPSDGVATLNTVASNFDNVVNVYQGTMLGSLNLVASDHDALGLKDGYTQSQVKFPVKSGQVFKIQVGGNGYVTGTVVLNMSVGALTGGGITHSGGQYYGAPSTFNDNFNNADTISNNTFTAVGFNGSATLETGEPRPDSLGGTLWWSWTAPVSGTVTINTIGTTFDNVLSVFKGTVVSSLTQVATNHNGLGTVNGLVQSQVQFTVTSGTTYKIQVGAYENSGATGTVLLNVNLPLPTGTAVQTITFPAIAAQTLGTGAVTFKPAATSSSGLTVTYTILTNPVTVSGTTVTLTPTVTIQATQAGNSTYAPATPVNQTVTLK